MSTNIAQAAPTLSNMPDEPPLYGLWERPNPSPPLGMFDDGRVMHGSTTSYIEVARNHPGLAELTTQARVEQYTPPAFGSTVLPEDLTFREMLVAAAESTSNLIHSVSPSDLMKVYTLDIESNESTQQLDPLDQITHTLGQHTYLPSQGPHIPERHCHIPSLSFPSSSSSIYVWNQTPPSFNDNEPSHPVPVDNSGCATLPTSRLNPVFAYSTPDPARSFSRNQHSRTPVVKRLSSRTASHGRVNPSEKKSKKPIEKYRPCPVAGCGKLYDPKRSNWQRHMDTHTGRKRFKCTYKGCGERKTTKDQVIVHIVTHHMNTKLGKGVKATQARNAAKVHATRIVHD